MDAFKKVDDVTSNKVYKTDQQKDWQEWRTGTSGKAAAKHQASTTRHKPMFPKLGGFRDESHLAVGLGDEVRVPELDAEKPGDKKRKNDQHESSSFAESWPEDDDVWVELFNKETKEPYYFNRKTGKTQYERPCELMDKPTSFIPSEKFDGARPEYAFKDGDFGLGYYLEKRRPESVESKKPPKKQKLMNNPNPMEQVQRAIERQKQTETAHKKKNKTTAPPLVDQQSWQKAVDPLSRKVFWFNHATNERRETDPNASEQTKTESDRKFWQRMKDPETGKTVWYNRKTGETKSQKPK